MLAGGLLQEGLQQHGQAKSPSLMGQLEVIEEQVGLEVSPLK